MDIINLSKEHIEECCDLVEGFTCGVDDSMRGDFKWHLKAYEHMGYINDADNLLYVAFLQLVIEAIEEKHNIFTKIQRYDKKRYSCCLYDKYGIQIALLCKIGGTVNPSATTRIEAKEKAITYVLNNRKEIK